MLLILYRTSCFQYQLLLSGLRLVSNLYQCTYVQYDSMDMWHLCTVWQYRHVTPMYSMTVWTCDTYVQYDSMDMWHLQYVQYDSMDMWRICTVWLYWVTNAYSMTVTPMCSMTVLTCDTYVWQYGRVIVWISSNILWRIYIYWIKERCN